VKARCSSISHGAIICSSNEVFSPASNSQGNFTPLSPGSPKPSCAIKPAS